MHTTEFSVTTPSRDAMVDITSKVQDAVRQAGVDDGLATVYVPHTTAGVTVNEGADPDVVRDMTMELNKIVPFEDGYRHAEGNSAAHIKASMMGSSAAVMIDNGKLVLGTWQAIFFCEFDGPRTRRVLVRFN